MLLFSYAIALLALILMWKLKALPFGMTALAADRITEKKDRGLKWYPVAAVKVYAGSLVAINSSGFLIPAANAAGNKVVGVCRATVDNAAGAAGDLKAQVEAPVLARFPATSITQAMVGQVMYVVDDQTFDDVLGTAGIKAGRLVEFISTTEGWLQVQETGQGTVLADADLTYSQNEVDLINELKTIINQRVL